MMIVSQRLAQRGAGGMASTSARHASRAASVISGGGWYRGCPGDATRRRRRIASGPAPNGDAPHAGTDLRAPAYCVIFFLSCSRLRSR